jgi:hypothetical protein
MDMKEIFENGCFTPAWTEDEDIQAETSVPYRKDLDKLLSELAEIKENIENLQAKSWYLDRLRQYHEYGFSK